MSHRRASDLSAAERAEILRHSEVGDALPEETLALLASDSEGVDFRRRRFIYRRGDGADALFGESSLYSAGVREKCAIAYEQTRLLRIPAGVYREGMAASRELYDYTFRMVGQRLSRAERRVADFALDAIPARLDKLLVDLCERYGRPEAEGMLIDLQLPHREIASIVGSTRESVTVRLNALRRAGIIDFVDRKILIKTPAATAAV